jgi:hypothetical protein
MTPDAGLKPRQNEANSLLRIAPRDHIPYPAPQIRWRIWFF